MPVCRPCHLSGPDPCLWPIACTRTCFAELGTPALLAARHRWHLSATVPDKPAPRRPRVTLPYWRALQRSMPCSEAGVPCTAFAGLHARQLHAELHGGPDGLHAGRLDDLARPAAHRLCGACFTASSSGGGSVNACAHSSPGCRCACTAACTTVPCIPVRADVQRFLPDDACATDTRSCSLHHSPDSGPGSLQQTKLQKMLAAHSRTPMSNVKPPSNGSSAGPRATG